MNKGITLVSLVITIIVILIMTGIVLKIMNDNNIINIAQQEGYRNQLIQLKEKFDVYILAQETKAKNNHENFNKDDINVEKHDAENLKQILGDIPDKLLGKIWIGKGKLCIDVTLLTEKETELAKSVDILAVTPTIPPVITPAPTPKPTDVVMDIPLNAKVSDGSSTYEPDTIYYNVDSEGIVTINGSLPNYSNVFLRMQNDQTKGIAEMLMNSTTVGDCPAFINKKKFVKLDIEKISGSFKGSQAKINIGLRTVNNTINGLITLNNENSNYSTDWIVLNDDVNIAYIYISKTTECSNLKLKASLKTKNTNYNNSDIVNDVLKMYTGKTELGEFQCSINENGSITLNGKVTNNIYIKISNGLDLNKNIISDTDTILIPTNQKVTFDVEKVSGTISNSNTFNMVLKYKDGTQVFNYNLLQQETASMNIDSTTNDISIAYLYLTANSEFNNYIITPNLIIES